MDLSVNIKKRNTIIVWIMHFIICSGIFYLLASDFISTCLFKKNYRCEDDSIFLIFLCSYFPVLVSGILLSVLKERYILVFIFSLAVSLLSWWGALFCYAIIGK